MKSILLKDINLSPNTNCPSQYVHIDGTEGVICDREGLKYIVSKPLLLGVIKLYDINIRTLSSGSNKVNEIGISCDWESLDANNKKIVEKYLKQKGLELIPPCPPHAPETRFRIGIQVSDNETVETAEQKILQEIENIGLVKQDVSFGKLTIEDVHKEYSFGLDLPLEEAIQYFKEKGGIIVGDTAWVSKELYEKHQDYIMTKETAKQTEEYSL